MSRLPILMYHNITLNSEESFDLTLSIQKFEDQLKFLKEHNFTSIFVSELENIDVNSTKHVVLTFDDVTQNQLLNAMPLLKKYDMKATFFIPFFYLGKEDLWNEGSEKIMTIEELKSLDSDIIELGHHSYFHKKYSELSNEEIQDDFDKSFKFISDNNLKVYPALAYPYGNYPKKGSQKAIFFNLLEKNNIKLAFRIGNRLNQIPIKNRFEMQRIDIKGQDSLFTFKWKLRLGKLSLF
ncbi:polysaccharide deacetylase family protein [Flavobacterium sp.]|jgi:peptidoglycan/xylan/chitin deacetylase (PgdA/CDA1 family)|uniref:polysaccharide deacetylase family protein n=1 Tax=Flavobacterium sp. TaxID=239 RepID=UPI0037C12996